LAIGYGESIPNKVIVYIQADYDLLTTYQGYIAEAELILAGFKSRLPANDFETKREMLDYTIAGILVETQGRGNHKTAGLTIAYKVGNVAVIPFPNGGE
jgi:hypothetical protein